MSKRTFISFGIFVLVLAVAIPFFVFRERGGTDGNYGPDLDELLAPSGPPEGDTAASTIKATEGRVLNAVENGVDGSTTPGRMPGGILNKEQAKEVSEFGASVAGEG